MPTTIAAVSHTCSGGVYAGAVGGQGEGERMRSGERSLSEAHRRGWWPPTKLGAVVLFGLIAGAMVASVLLYVNGAASKSVLTHGRPTSSGITVTLNLVTVQNSYDELVGDLAVKPGPTLVDEATYALKEDLTVAVTSVTTPVRRTWSKGMLPGVFPVPLTLARDVERWPFDSYHTGPITVELFTGASQTPERASVTFGDLVGGWKVHVGRVNNANDSSPYVVELGRSASTMVFAVVILCIFVAIAAIGLFVALQTFRNPAMFQAPLATWYAAMLFAVLPLRNALPGSPAFGSWIDLTIVLWVLVALVVSMLLYIAAWWRALSTT
ncbi:DUF4436 domain-containing protein [Mycobacterium numidiamassiliense]|nr:DUF4436 domain-containing protein [Mycobacterium numidiamassiliense]